jgi:hypothetical protein
LGHGVGEPRQEQQRQQRSQRVRQGGGRDQAGRRHEHAGAHRRRGTDALREATARACPERAREKEDRDPGDHRLHAHVEVAADLKRQGPDQKAGKDGGRAGRDRECGGADEPYASPTRFAIGITPTTQSTVPITSNTAPALIIRVIGSIPEE